MISIRCSLSSEVMVSAIRTAVILVALLLWAESRLIVLSTRAQESLDGWHHRLWDQQHFHSNRPGNVDQGRRTRCRNARLDVPVAWPRNAREIGHLLLGQPRS